MAKGFGGRGGMGGMGMNANMLKQAQKMQQDMMRMQQELQEKEYQAAAGGGVVSATVNGKQCGSFGDYAAISYNGNKIITTSGGGMLLSDDEAGTCIIEMPDEIIDASASTQLKNIRDLIHEI